MSISTTWCRILLASVVGCAALPAGVAHAAAPVSSDPHADLMRAEEQACLGTLSAKCRDLLNRLDQVADQLQPEQRQHLRFDQSWAAALSGDYRKADALLQDILSESRDPNLRMQAAIQQVNLLAEQSRYEQAFRQLSQLIVPLQDGTGIHPEVRERGFNMASELYAEAGQYELASYYADQIFKLGLASPGYTCVDDHARIQARFDGGQWQDIEPLIRQGVDVCIKEHNSLYANGIRYFAAELYLKQGHTGKALALLQKNYPTVKRDGYPLQVAQFNALLAEAYWKAGQLEPSRQAALASIAHGTSTPYAEPMVTAYRVLYLLDKQQGLWHQALIHHEQYMAAAQGHLDQLNARSLAYQTVHQQVLAEKTQISALNKQNEILQLQHSLGKKAMITSRLYTLLLLLTLGFIALWSVRIKRSQLRFQKLARRDGLTGIYNRQHFIDEATRQLRYCAHSAREACAVLIDLDHFKRLNDTFGHAVGDKVLRQVVRICQESLRSTDILGRIGGEEFGILLPECTLEKAIARIEQLRAAIAATALREGATNIFMSASFGLATTARSGHDLHQLMIHADDALYEAKSKGRNCAVVFDPTLGAHMGRMRQSLVAQPELEQGTDQVALLGGRPDASIRPA